MNFGPTLNKKSQDCLVILCLVKELATRHISNYNRFSIKKHATYIIWTTLTRQYFYAKLSQHGQHNIVLLYVLFSQQKLFVSHGPTFPCAMLTQIDHPENCRLFCGAKLFVDNGKHCLSNLSVQCQSRQIKITLYKSSSWKNITACPGPTLQCLSRIYTKLTTQYP